MTEEKETGKKFVEKSKIVEVPKKGQEIFKGLAEELNIRDAYVLLGIDQQSIDTRRSRMLLWQWAVYNNSWLSSFMDNTLMNFNPPKAINREIQGFFVPHGDNSVAIKMEWKEPKK
jgi:hypothetical protein